VGDETWTHFWEDPWLGESPLASQYPSLFNIVRTKEVTIADVFSQVPLIIRFHRALTWHKWNSWVSLVRTLMRVHLNDEPDSFKWHLTTKCVFTDKPMYTDYMNGHTLFLKKYLWKIKVPLKIGIFMCSFIKRCF
jgi:hypothetical protein